MIVSSKHCNASKNMNFKTPQKLTIQIRESKLYKPYIRNSYFLIWDINFIFYI